MWAVSAWAASSRGTLRAGQMVVRCNYLEQDKTTPPWRLTGLFQYDGLKRLPAESVGMGDIVALTGLEDIAIGDTVCAPEAWSSRCPLCISASPP